jgi:hypothetical protein
VALHRTVPDLLNGNKSPEAAGVVLLRKRFLILISMALLSGCSSTTWSEHVQVPNWFGTPFQDREAVLLAIPPGTPVAQAFQVSAAVVCSGASAGGREVVELPGTATR